MKKFFRKLSAYYSERFSWENGLYLVAAWSLFRRRFDANWISQQLDQADWIFPLNILPAPVSPTQYLIAYMVCAGIFVILALLPRSYPLLALTVYWVATALLFPLGKISYSGHGILYALMGMSLAKIMARKERDASYNYAIVMSTFIYTASGLWKLRYLLAEENIWRAAVENLPEHIAFGLAENYRPDGAFFLNIFYHSEFLSAVSWFLVIATQILAPVAILFFNPWRWIFLITLMAFHLMAEWIVGPAFTVQVYFLAYMAVVSLYTEWIRPRLFPKRS